MDITFDPAKNASNIEARGLSFERVVDFDFETALIWVDDRKAYPEVRYFALGLIAGRYMPLCSPKPPPVSGLSASARRTDAR